MKKRILSVLALVLACAMVLSACGGSSGGQQSGGNSSPASTPSGGGSAPADDGTVYKLSIARNLPESDPACIGDAEFARLLEEKSGGRFDVTLYLNSSVIANDTEALEKVADGTIQFTSTTAATCASYAQIPELNVFNEPMMFETEDEIWTLAESDYMKDFYQKFQDATGVIISPKGFSMGWYGVGTVKQDITDMGALKGLKLRVANVPQQLSMVEAMGAAPTSINWNEIFTTLQQGTVDGILLTSGLLYNNGFYETLSYYKNTRICSCYHMFIVNAEWYNSLPGDLQQIFDECLAEATETYRQGEIEAENNAVAQMVAADINCMECTEAEMAALQEYAVAIWRDESKSQVNAECINTVLDILGKGDLKI